MVKAVLCTPDCGVSTASVETFCCMCLKGQGNSPDLALTGATTPPAGCSEHLGDPVRLTCAGSPPKWQYTESKAVIMHKRIFSRLVAGTFVLATAFSQDTSEPTIRISVNLV